MDEEVRSSPSSGVMKPNPLSALNHLTVPVAMLVADAEEAKATTAGAGPAGADCSNYHRQ